MAKALFYRRSFHSDRDLLGIPPLELDHVLGGPQLIPSRKGLEGLEAPRNSLDIQPSSIQAEARGDIHSRPEDIPMGFELTRSLTTPKKRDDQSQPKFMQFSEITKVEPEQKRRSTNVIARLMGLDFMPVSGGARSLKVTSAEKQPQHPKKQDRLLSVHSLTDLPIQEWHAEFENETKPRETLSFREHPQEQQLQEFKREFACRLAAQEENVRLKEAEFRQSSKSVRRHEMHADFMPPDDPKCCASSENTPASIGLHSVAPEKSSNSREFMEALQFLQANKKLFLDVLHNRKSPMSARLQEAVRGKPIGRPKPSRPADKSKEIRKLERLPETSMPRTAKNRLLMQAERNANNRGKNEGGSAAKKPSSPGGSWRQSVQKKFQPNETMPSQKRGRTKRSGAGNCGGGNSNQKAERIVVLQPSSKSEMAKEKAGEMICTLHPTRERAKEKTKPLKEAAEALMGKRKGRRNETVGGGKGKNSATDGGGGVSDSEATPRQKSGAGRSATGGSLPGSPKRGGNAGGRGGVGGRMGGVDDLQNKSRGGATISPPTRKPASPFRSAPIIKSATDAALRSPIHRPPVAPAADAPTPQAPLPPSMADYPRPTPPIDAQDSSSETSCTDKCEQPSPVSVLDAAATWRSYAHLAPLNADFHLGDILCPASKRQQLLYIRDILVAAGFSAHGIVIVRCFSAQYGLDPGLFRCLESQYSRKRFYPPVATLQILDRRLLFDAVDQIILNKFGMPCELHHPRFPPNNSSSSYMRSGKQLLQQIWTDLSSDLAQDFDSADEDMLKNLVARDLSSSWVPTCSELESVSGSIEVLILDSLVEEAIHDFTTLQMCW